MKTATKTISVIILVGLAISSVAAQRPDGPPRGEGPPRGSHPDGFRPPPHPIMEAIDANGDQELSSDEIANAAAALKALDANSDGTLTRDELRPPRGNRQARGERANRRERGGPGGGRPESGREFGPPPGEGGPDGEGRPRGEGRPGGEGRRGPRAQGGGQFDADKFVDRVMKFDEDEDGLLTAEELPERMKKMIDKGDGDDDGALSKEELLAMASSSDMPGLRRAARGRAGEGQDRPERTRRSE